MVRHAGIADCAEKYGVERPQLVEPVFRHHAAGFRIDFATPVEFAPFQAETIAPRGRFEHGDPLRHDLAPDPVAGNDRNTIVFRHSICLRLRKSAPKTGIYLVAVIPAPCWTEMPGRDFV